MSPTPITVLLVDDHRSVLRGLEWLINSESPEMAVVGTTTTADEAGRLCSKLRPDVLILDLDLGGHNGGDAIPQLIANGHTAVLVLTGVRNPDAHQAAIIAGARGVVPKEADAETIVKAIRKVHAGEIWLDRLSTQKVLSALTHHKGAASAIDAAIASLTPREREIILALTTNAGAPAKQIASLLNISEHTLRNHLSSIYDKVGVSNRLGLYEFAQKRRLAGN